MAVFGIVSEFNPFHFGHEYLISCAKERGADAVVCVMSGNSTQRGELAIIDKYLRAEACVSGGADLVLELPFPWSSASAEGFATAAIHILSSFCKTVIFGSECGDIDLLYRAADLALSEEFKESYAEKLSSGSQSALAYVSLIEEAVGVKLSSNDLLGVEYIKAAKKASLDIDFVTVKREGSAYLEKEVRDDGFDSAMAIRNSLAMENFEELLSGRLPARSFELLCSAKNKGEMVEPEKYGELIRSYFRLFEASDKESFAECDGGVLERICRMAHESASPSEFWSMLSTKRYTDAKLRRAVLFAICKVLKSDVASMPAYTYLLGADARGRELLSDKRRKINITVITKPADVMELTSCDAARQHNLEQKLASIYNFCLVSSAPTGESMKKKPYIT